MLAACELDPEPRVVFDVAPAGEALRYDALPYPNDLFLVDDGAGGRRVEVAGLEALLPRFTGFATQALAQMDGFGTSSAVRFDLTGAVDVASLPATAAASLEPGSSVFLARLGAAGGVVERVPVEVAALDDGRTLSILPAVALEPEATYVAVLTRALRAVPPRGTEALAVRPSPDLEAIFDPEAYPTDDANLLRARELYADPLAAVLALDGVAGIDDLAALAVFTTQDTLGPLVAARRAVASGPAPEVALDRVWSTPAELDALLGAQPVGRPGLDNAGGVIHEHVALLATGSFTSIDYLTSPVAEGGLERVLTRLREGVFDDARWVVEEGEPVPQGVARVPFAIALPAAPPPGATAMPVVIFQHATGGSRADVMAVADPLNAAGYAVVAIDAVRQGGRYWDADEEHNFTGAPGADGFVDASAASSVLGIFEAFSNLLAVRDNLRQTVVDQLALVRWLRDPATDLAAIGAPPLDPERIFYVSKSIGSVVGTALLALEPAVTAGVLSVGGGGVGIEVLTGSPEIGATLPLFAAIAGIDDACVDRFDPFVNLIQSVVDPGDPLAWARHVILDPLDAVDGGPGRASHVLLGEAMGDQTIPNPATERLARELGLELATPAARPVEGLVARAAPFAGNLSGGGAAVTGALVQWNPAGHGSLDRQVSTLAYVPGFPFPCPDRFPRLDEPILVDNPIEATHKQMLRFLESARASADGVPEVAITAVPIPD